MKIIALVPLLFVSFCPAQESQTAGVVPVPVDEVSSTEFDSIMGKLNQIESKIDQNLTVMKSVKQDTTTISAGQLALIEALKGLKDSNKSNSVDIVAAIKDTNKKPKATTAETKTVILSQPATRTVTRSVYRSISAPRWNLNGSWTRVRNRGDLLSHLATEHSYSQTWMQSMTIQQLWALHDDSHNGGRMLGVVPVNPNPNPINPAPPANNCPGGICPTPGSRFRLFPRLWRR